MKFSHLTTYYLLRLLKKIFSSLKPSRRHNISVYLANKMFFSKRLRSEQAFKNIRKAFPTWPKEKILSTLKECYIFFTSNLIEFISTPKSWEGIEINVIGEKVLDEALKKNRGVVFISGHFGSWEILGKWLGENTDLFVGIALKQKNEGANNFFHEQREIPGTKQIYKKGSLDKGYKVLKDNGVLGLVSDQDAKSKGVFVDFFRHPASTPKGAALFHLNTLAPVVLGVCIKTDHKKYNIEIVPVKTNSNSVEQITQNYTSILESYIKKYPEQYFWFHKRWKTKVQP